MSNLSLCSYMSLLLKSKVYRDLLGWNRSLVSIIDTLTWSEQIFAHLLRKNPPHTITSIFFERKNKAGDTSVENGREDKGRDSSLKTVLCNIMGDSVEFTFCWPLITAQTWRPAMLQIKASALPWRQWLMAICCFHLQEILHLSPMEVDSLGLTSKAAFLS